ncbi:MAG: hypothetical protein HKP20_01890 [Akkermansiaceae bacterium]|nr:hypothetical protein [Akkermansiaceae bacterium]
MISNNGQTIDLRLAPERVLFNRWVTYVTHKDQWGDANVVVPEFHTQRVTTAITVVNKKPKFLTIYTPLGKDKKLDPTRKILVFVKATVVRP